MRSLLNRAFLGLLAVLLGLGAFPVTSQAQHGGGSRHCPSAPTLIAGGDPTDCMYNGDVELTSITLQLFEGAITASGAIRITGTTPINTNGNLILDGGSIILDAPISGNTADSITINTRGSVTYDPNTVVISTGTIRLATASAPTRTPSFTLISTTGTTPTINTDNVRTIATPLTISTDTAMLSISAGDLILSAATSSSPARMFILSEGQSLAAGSALTATDGTTFTLSEGDNLILTSATSSTTPSITLNADPTPSLTLNAGAIADLIATPITINTGAIADLIATPITINTGAISLTGAIADLIATPITSLTINERQPLAVGSTISTDAGMLPISAGNLILRLATSSSPAMMFVLSEGQSLTVGSTLTAIDGTTFTLSEGDNLILNTLSTTGIDNLELIDSNGNPITLSPQATEEATNDPTSSNNSSSTGAIVGGISGGVVLLTSVVYWFWPSDKAPLAQFQAFNADAYLPARQWIGMEHALTENIKFAVGSFWLSDDTVNTIIPSMDNTGVDVRLSLAPRGFGEFSFSAAAYNYKDTDSQYKEDGTTTDLFLDNFQVSNERLEFGYALGLQWSASF